MSENRITFTLIGTFALIGFMVLCFIFFTAILLYVSVGIAVLALVALVGFAWRKWQHSGLPVHESKREYRRLELEEYERTERLRIERERHEHEMSLERVAQAH